MRNFEISYSHLVFYIYVYQWLKFNLSSLNSKPINKHFSFFVFYDAAVYLGLLHPVMKTAWCTVAISTHPSAGLHQPGFTQQVLCGPAAFCVYLTDNCFLCNLPSWVDCDRCPGFLLRGYLGKNISVIWRCQICLQIESKNVRLTFPLREATSRWRLIFMQIMGKLEARHWEICYLNTSI